MYEVGIDIGGTFTDAVLVTDDGDIFVAKVPTTPADLRDCFFNAIDAVVGEAGVPANGDGGLRRIVHGTTIATNIMVQHNGATTALLATKGFGDTIHIMQGHGYTVGIPDEMVTRIQQLVKPDPIIPKRLVRDVPERIDSEGRVVVALDEAALRRQVTELLEQGADSFAICFLWSFVNDVHERRAREIVTEMAPEAFISISSEVAPRIGEYNRTVATAINAYVGPATSRYVGGLDSLLTDRASSASLTILQCSGGVVSPAQASQSPVRLIGSGPVGGTIATQTLGKSFGESNVIACDMGGTSFDVSVVADGEIIKQNLGVINQYEYSVPSVEIQSIGAGGGSIAWIDEGTGTMRVGPQSAGSQPGPACYGRGGTLPTVTDCDLLVGYLNESHDLAGGLRLDLAKAEKAAREHLAEPLGLTVIEAALGALQIVDTQMAELIRQLTVGRGLDPRDFVVFAFGGAGPVHAPVFAGELGVKYVVIPRGQVASLWSAFGAVSSDVLLAEEQFFTARAPFDPAELERSFSAIEAAGRESLAQMGVEPDAMELRRSVDLRYGAQVHVLSVAVPPRLDNAAMEQMLTDFDELYEARNGPGTGYREAGVESTALRVEAVGRVTRTSADEGRAGEAAPEIDTSGHPRRVVHWGGDAGAIQTPIIPADDLRAGRSVRGPAVIELPTTTVPVRPGSTLRVDPSESFILDLPPRS